MCPLIERKIIKGVRYKSYEESYDECTCDNKMKMNNESGDARVTVNETK